MAVENLHDILCLRNILRNIMADNLTLVVLVEHFFLHHTLTHCRHLWTVLRVDDCRNDVSAKGRTNLVELLLIVLGHKLTVIILHLHVKIADFKLRAVGCQTAEQCRRDTRTEVASDDSGTEEAYLWLLLLEEIDHK